MKRGFTLVEVVVVVAILAISAAVVAPALVSAARTDPLARTAGELTGLLTSARIAAVERGTPVTVAVTLATGRYVVTIERRDSSTVLAEGGLVLDDVRLAAGGRPAVRVRFDPLGPAEPDSVSVLGTTGHRVVRVDPWTGEVRADAH